MNQRASDSDPNLEGFENVLYKEVGQLGKFQIINILLLVLPAVFSGFMAGDYVFTAGRIPHRCAVPECDGQQPIYAPEWILNAVPATSTGFDECSRFANAANQTINVNLVDDVCPANFFNRNITVRCESYVYERTNTVVYDFNLECEEWLRALSGTLNSLGAMIALPLAGVISDYFGRRVSIVVFGLNGALVGFIRAFSVNYTMYVVLQFMHTAIGGGMFSAAYILAAELVGPKYRVVTSATMSTLFALGQVILGAIASAVHPWRTLTLVLFTPGFVIILYIWIITESPRWLLSRNKQKKGKATLEKAAKWNGREISEKSMNYLLAAIPQQLKTNKEEDKQNLFLRVLKSPVMLRRCCATPVMWIATTFIYYGLSINSVNLSGNMYVNYIAIAAIEIPGFWTAVLVLNRIGRKATLFCGYTLCGLCCIAFAFTPDDMYSLSLILFLTGKYCIGLTFTSLYLYTSELYPTRHRHSFLGFSSMIGRIGSVISPLTPPLMVYWSGIPSVLFGGMAILAAFLVLSQPETHGLKVPDTFEDAEKIGKFRQTL